MDKTDPVEIEIGMTDRWEVVRNIANNGRLFMVMICVVALVLEATRSSMTFGLIAALSVIPVGASCIIDQLPRPIARVCSIAVYCFAAVLAASLIIATI